MMRCKFCDVEIDPETHGGTRTCDNCWEVSTRLERMPTIVVTRLLAQRQALPAFVAAHKKVKPHE